MKSHFQMSPDDQLVMKMLAGGSIANTVRGLSAGFGVSCGIIGAYGDNDQGQLFVSNMSSNGVNLSRLRMKSGPTGQVSFEFLILWSWMFMERFFFFFRWFLNVRCRNFCYVFLYGAVCLLGWWIGQPYHAAVSLQCCESSGALLFFFFFWCVYMLHYVMYQNLRINIGFLMR